MEIINKLKKLGFEKIIWKDIDYECWGFGKYKSACGKYIKPMIIYSPQTKCLKTNFLRDDIANWCEVDEIQDYLDAIQFLFSSQNFYRYPNEKYNGI